MGCPAFGRYISASPKSNAVAITFDDGPSPYTIDILDALAANNITASFAIVGKWADAQPEIVERMVAEGHELINHGWSHLDLRTLSNRHIHRELKNTNDLITRFTGKPPCLFRPPYGKLNDQIIYIAAMLNLAIIKQTRTIDQYPYPYQTADDLVTKADQTEAGDILLLHDGGHPKPVLLTLRPSAFYIEGDPNNPFETLVGELAGDKGFEVHDIDYLTPNLSDGIGDLQGEWDTVQAAVTPYASRDLYVWGDSAGATYSSLLAEHGLVKAAVANCPVPDLTTWAAEFPNVAANWTYTSQLLIDLSPDQRATISPILTYGGLHDPLIDYTTIKAWADTDPLVIFGVFDGLHLGVKGGTIPDLDATLYRQLVDLGLDYLLAKNEATYLDRTNVVDAIGDIATTIQSKNLATLTASRLLRLYPSVKQKAVSILPYCSVEAP